MSTDVISAVRLSKTYSHQGYQQHVLSNLDLTIPRGEFLVVMGPSGAGKSTLMHTLSGLDRPSLGQVWFDGEDIAAYDEKRLGRFRRGHCGFVFQQIHLLDGMNVLDNVLAVGYLLDRPREDVRRRARELFALVGLGQSDWDKFPDMLSGGEAQRAAVVRALINEPAVLFADEPTGQLNSDYSRRVLDLLTQVHVGGQTVVMVTHDLRSALRGERVVYLRDGAVRGECRLGRWDADDAQRHTRLTAFLDAMGW